MEIFPNVDTTLEELFTKNEMEAIKKFLEEELLPSSSRWDDYYFLRDLIRAGEVAKVKECLEMGFRVNKYSLCMHHLEHVHTTPLHAAVDLGNEEVIKLLIEKGASINARDYNCDTPLTLAANSEKYQIVDYLLSVSGTKNTGNEYKFDHVLIACMRNRIDVAKKLFQYGACRNHAVLVSAPAWPGWNALHFAVCFECVEMVQFLLDHGIEIRARDKKGSTPLHFAFEKQNETIVDKILSVHRFYPGNPINCQGLSHFHIVCARNNVELVKDFVQRDIKLDYKVSRKSPKWRGFNAINFAIEYGHLDVLRCLKACNKISCLVNDKNFRSLVKHAQEKNHPAIVNFLDSCKCCQKLAETQECSSHCPMETDEYPDLLPSPEFPRFSDTPTRLHFAVQEEESPSIEFLRMNKSDIIVKDSRGKTPLHLAFENDRMDLVEKLVSLHGDIHENPTDNNGLSHFHIFCTVYNLDIVDKFIENGVDVNNSIINTDSTFFPGFSPLHMAIRFDATEVVELLLTHRADITHINALGTNAFELAIQHLYVDLPIPRPFSCFRVLELVLSEIGHRKLDDFDTKGYTLLHIASAENDIESIKRLANKDTLNALVRSDLKPQFKGFTPLHFAAFYHQDEAIELLLDLGADNSSRDFRGNTPAHSRLRHPDYWVLQDNIDSRLLFCKENFTSADGISNLHLVCRRNDLEAVRYYLDMGVDVNARMRDPFSSRDYATPLHLALNGGCKKVAELLLERGADINAESRSGRTPLITYSPDIPPAERLQLIMILMKHIKKLEMLERPVSIKNLKWYAIFMGERELTDIYKEQEFVEDCTRELGVMKGVILSKFCTLHDVLFRNSNAMARICRNSNLQGIIWEENFKANFPNFWSFLELSFEEGIMRMHLLDKAEHLLNELSGNWLSSTSRSIVEYLTSEEIEIFIKGFDNVTIAEKMEE